MDVDFKKRKLRKIFESEARLKRQYGDRMAGAIMLRMGVLQTSRCLAEVPIAGPVRCHQIREGRDEQFAVDLIHPYRLVFEVEHDPMPRKEDGGINRESVTAMVIIEVIDYHWREKRKMAASADRFDPDYAVPPGWMLEEQLDAHGLSQAEFARRCDSSPRLISEIISGKAALEPEIALRFEKVLGVSVNIWLGLESGYRLRQARDAEIEAARGMEAWAKSFPLADLVKRGCFSKPESSADAVSKLLRFFGVASIDAWRVKYSETSVAYRHSAAFESDVPALATWFRLGELSAERQECAEYNASRFKAVLLKIRNLTGKPIDETLPCARRLCNEAGVALVLVKPLPKTALSGAAWWHSSAKTIIQLSARHKTDDHLWFGFFHEAAHILLHGKKRNNMKNVFVDARNGDGDPIENEADAWASDFLVSRKDWDDFLARCPQSAAEVRRFAKEQRIAPGIVVGRLQRERIVPWSHLNGLKVKLEWG